MRRSRTDAARSSPSLNAKERLRRRHRPKKVRILFVGEAPPASGRFFYQGDSGLYRAMREAFLLAFPHLKSTDFLDAFQSLGCYLVDLCGRPVDQMEMAARRGVCLSGEGRLSRRIFQMRPKVIVTVVRSIGANVRRAEVDARWSGLHVELPYPGRWHHYRKEFRRKLMPLLRAKLREGGCSETH